MSRRYLHGSTVSAGESRATCRAVATGSVVLFLAMVAANPAPAQQHRELEPSRPSVRALRFDVAMDGSSFHFEGPTNDAGFPADGTPFIIRGYIYPSGTFDTYGSASGTNPDGSPQFPDLVLGTWYCRGWHLQDGDALSGPIVATTQIFDLNVDRPGRQTIVTDGIELADFGVSFERAVVGGTGRYADPAGQSTQVYVDFNASLGFNTSFVIRLRR